MAYSHILCLIYSIHLSFVPANIVIIQHYEPDVNEYYCDPNESCIIRCVSTSSCSKSTLYCPPDHDCDIICDPNNEHGSNACFESTIHAEHSTHLSITVTAHQSNAQSMIIYAPYPDPNNNQQSILTCYSSETTLSQCHDLQIYATHGFNDIKLLCNDATSLCAISGSITCSSNQYESESHEGNRYNECTQFAFNTDQAIYQCLNRNICVDTTNNRATVEPSTRSVLPFETASPTSLTIAPTPMPTFYIQHQPIIAKANSGDIHALILVVVGTGTITCVILIILGSCGLVYIRLNKENVENLLIRRYLEGRGTLSYAERDIATDETSKEGSSCVSGCIDNEEVESQDSADLGLIPLNTNKENSDSIPEYPSLMFEDEMGNIINEIHRINIKRTVDDHPISLVSQPSNEPQLALSVPYSSNKSNNTSVNADMGSQDSLIGESQDTLSSVSHSPMADVHIALPCTTLYTAANHMRNDDETRDGYPVIPLPTPPSRLIGPDFTPKQLQQRAEIHLENLRNRSRCFGYIQPEILYEVSENFSSDSDDDTKDNNDDDVVKVKIVQQTNTTLKNAEGSDTEDDLLDDGMIGTNLQSEIKIEATTLTAPRSCTSMNDPEILSDDGQLPSLPINNY